MSSWPLCELELRANDQGRRLESSVLELKSKIREKLDVKNTARQHWVLAGAIAWAVALASGYALAVC